MIKGLFFVLSAILITTSIYGQTKDCDCSRALSTDLKDFSNSSEYKTFKDWLYTYYQKDETTRSSMKSNSNFGGKFQAVVEGMPTGGGFSNSSSKDKQKYQRVEQFFLQNRIITDETLNELFVEQFSDNQLKAYTRCLESCEQILGGGLSAYVGGNLSDEFFVQVKFVAQITGSKVTLKNDAIYTNLEPINGLVFKDNTTFIDKQTITQWFKRIDPTKAASFSFNVQEGIAGLKPITIPAKPPINQQAIPVGTIVASILEYNTFLKANGLHEMDNLNMETVLWIPCDGRKENKSLYSKYSGGNIPDLRGVFLRGINDYNVTFPSVMPVTNQQKNPENKVAGEFQIDIVGKHSHGWTGTQGNGFPKESEDRMSGDPTDKDRAYVVKPREGYSKSGVGLETRPKNVTVYYYIKIN